MNFASDESQAAYVGPRILLERLRYIGSRLTLSFIVVAVVFTAIAAFAANRVVGNLAEDNLIRIAEENTSRNAVHLDSMMRAMATTGDVHFHGTPDTTSDGDETDETPLTLDSLVGPDGLPSTHRGLVEGLNIGKLILFDPNGYAVWSSDPANLGQTKPRRGSSFYWEAAAGDVASKFVSQKKITDLDGVERRIDIVETYLPLRDTREGEIIGVLEIDRDVGGDIAIQVQDAGRTVLWTTIGTMGGLFLALLGFIVVADLSISRSRRHQRQVAAELATEVKERASANKELETFSYSVSHDLRAPLRSLDGYSQILLDDFGTQLDEVGSGYLERIRANSQRMSQLIDDMLQLSRMSGGQIQYEQVDLSALVESICNDLKETQPDRDVTFVHAKGIAATGDPTLLRAAIENLLGNAWKYTGKHQHATIEFGSARENGREVYFVKDDGAGFDMAYADKLFLPFQRLHGEGEFDGTGIGLATVQRIIRRHGGDIWAESEPDQGTTFYFTLS